MIRDLDVEQFEPEVNCDICLVGVGVVGLAMLIELSRSNLSVVALESGGRILEARTTSLTAAEVVGRPFPGAVEGRFRVLGGTSIGWGGQALPLEPFDFEAKPWLAHRGWPFGRATVDPFYARAASFLGIDDDDFDRSVFSHFRFVPPEFDRDLFRMHVAKWAPEPKLWKLHGKKFERLSKIDIVLHANLVRVDLADDGSVDMAVARSLSGREMRVRPRVLVLAAGAIENARLLLASNHQRRSGIGNESGLVGRFLQDHPTARIGTLTARDPRALQRTFNMFYRSGRKYSVRVSATEAFQRRHFLPAMSCGFGFDQGPDGAVTRLRTALRAIRENPRHALRPSVRAARTLPSLTAPATSYLVSKRAYLPGATVQVVVNTEQEPDPESRVSLAPSLDALGLPKARIDWRISSLTGRAIRLFSSALEAETGRLKLGDLALASWVLEPTETWRASVNDSYHHMGTTRMSEHPSDGVVNADGRVHDVPNLYIAGASNFPAGGHSNPTFTAIALALRMTDHLMAKLAARGGR